MFTTIEAFEAEALSLPLADRARLVDLLIGSLDAEADVEEAWVAEVVRRETMIVTGAAKWIDGPDALAQLKAEFA